MRYLQSEGSMRRIPRQSRSFLTTGAFKIVVFVMVMCVSSSAFGQETMAPLNPEFVQYMEDVQRGRDEASPEGGFALGEIPSILDLSHMRGVRVQDPDHPREGYDAAYDLRSLSRVSPVRNQGSCGACWTFATYASLESNLLTTESRDFSEEHMDDHHGFDWACCSGGNRDLSTAYLARWDGPIHEADDPYDDGDVCGNVGTGTVQKHVQQVIFLPPRASSTDNDNIKDAIVTYGAVHSSMRWEGAQWEDSTYYNHPGDSSPNPSSEAAYYYNGTSSSNHAITIIGWDDNFAASNFSTSPGGNGAFLIKNSWGSSWGNSGYFWISYYDNVLGKTNSGSTVYVNAEEVSNYEYNYQYDPFGLTGSLGYGSETGWFANVFSASSDQAIEAVSFYAASPGASYTISIHLSPDSPPIQSSGAAHTQSGALTHAGYHTIPLVSPVPVSAGQTFSAVVELTTPGYTSPIPCEFQVAGYSSAATANTGESYVSGSGSSWTDMAGWQANANVCLKVFASDETLSYTITASADTGGSISPQGSVQVSSGNTQAFTLTPDYCNILNELLIDGVADPAYQGISEASTYTFSNVITDHTIEADFQQISHTITASAGDGGSITPEGNVSVSCGDDQMFTITPDDSYAIDELLIDSIAEPAYQGISSPTTYTFSSVSADHIIDVSFVELSTTWHVTTTGSDVSGDGSAGNPFTTIQHAIDMSQDGDTVLVHEGTYVENINFNGQNITVASQYFTTGNDAYISQTIIDGNQNGSVVTFENGESSAARLFGVTITNGLSFSGGGISIRNSSNPTIDYCVVSNNSVLGQGGGQGGGLSCKGDSNPLVQNVIISGNTLEDGMGGGLYLGASSPMLKNVTITENTVERGYGGGVYLSGGSPVLDNVTITENAIIATYGPYSSYRGGGVYCGASNPILKGVIISDNTAVGYGGGVYWTNSNPIFDSVNRSSIYSNRALAGQDMYMHQGETMSVVLDSFSAIHPTDFYARPAEKFTFDILNGLQSQMDADLYVSPDGDDSNNGLSWSEPLRTIQQALRLIQADSLNPHTIYLAPGTYSPSTNGEQFPILLFSHVSLQGSGANDTIIDAEKEDSVFFLVYVKNSTIEKMAVTNGDGYWGGGMYLQESSPVIRNIIISNNSANDGAGIFTAGWESSVSPEPIITNAVISGNSTNYSGGVLSCQMSNLELTNLTIVDNSTNGSVFENSFECSLTLMNSIVWNNSYSNIFNTSATITYSNIETEYTGEGNISITPLFVDAATSDYHLSNGSPSIGTGTSIGAPTIDIEGNPRPNPDGSNPDMGAYENALGVSESHQITASTNSGGSIEPTGIVAVPEGNDQAYTMTPDACYGLADLLIDNISDPAYQGISEPSTYTFTNVSTDHSIEANFQKISHTITSSAGTGGNITPGGDIDVQCGGEQSFSITPDSGYQIADVQVDGISVGVMNSYTFTSIAENHTISAGFQPFCSPLAEGLHEDDAPGITYTAGWLQGSGIKYTNGADEEISFCFSGTAFTLYRTLASNRGEMEVCVDSSCQTVSNYAEATQSKQPVTFDGLSEETHTVTLSKSADDGSYIDLDAVYIGELDVCGALLAEGRHEEDDPDISFSSGWAQAGEIMYTNGASEEASFCFSGTEFTLYRTLAANRGSMELCVDDSCQTLSNYAAATQSSQPVTIDGLSEETHRVTIAKTDADSTYIDLDAVHIGPTGPDYPACPGTLTAGSYENDDSGAIAYTSGWATAGSLTYTNGAEEAAVFCFNDTEFTLSRTLAANRGRMEVCVDELCETVDNASASTQSAQPYSQSGLSAGEHTVVISKTDADSSYIDLDAITVGPSGFECSTPLLAGLHDNSATEIAYSAGWATAGSLSYTNGASEEANFCFVGRELTLYRTLAANRGEMELCVDELCETVDNYSATTLSAQPYTVSGLSFGMHTVSIRKRADDSTYIDLDAVEVSVCNGQLAAGTYEETAAEISYTSDWVAASSLMYTNDAEGVAGFCFSGTEVTIYRTLAANRGSLELCVDDFCETVDGYNASTQANQPYAVSGLEDGAHQVTLRKSADDGTYIDLSAVEIVADPCANPLGTGIYEEDASGISYTPGWATGSGIRYTNASSDTVSFCFSGTEVTIYRTLAANRGAMELCVDGACETVSNTSSATQWRQPYTTSGLSSGEHTLTIQKAVADGSYIDLDAVGVGMVETEAVEAVVVIRKAGTGQGTIQAGEQVCGADCEELTFAYEDQDEITVQVFPEEGSVFVGWQTEDGGSIEELFYANPGDTVYAVFDVE